VARLAQAYFRVRQGLGFNKSPQQFGAFPSDPYSHTPRHAGAQQPGMTGSVKEEILTRWGELGVEVHQGLVQFKPTLLPARELLATPGEFTWFDVDGHLHHKPLQPGELAFTFCQVPITYRLASARNHTVHWANGARQSEGGLLDAAASRALLGRTGELREVTVCLLARDFLAEG
jgi:hypothetical protein